MKITNKDYEIVRLSDLLNRNNSKVEEVVDLGYNTSLFCDMNLSFDKNVDEIFNDIKYLGVDYPEFHKWYHNKVIPDIKKGKREILFCLVKLEKGYEIGGISILKMYEQEKKICTLRVASKYRNNGVGKELFEESFKLLGTRKPLITISGKRIQMFKKYIEKYEFVLTEKLEDFYSKGTLEYVYNGNLK